MWIFPNLPQNADKIPNSTGPGPRTKNGCDGPAYEGVNDLAAGERLGRKFTCAPFIPHGRGLIIFY